MKRLLFIVILFITVQAQGQCRLGESSASILKEYGERVYYDEYIPELEIRLIKIQGQTCEIWHHISFRDIVVMTYIYPANGRILQLLREKYDEEYYSIGDDKWSKRFENGMLILIDIITNSEGFPVIIFRYE